LIFNICIKIPDIEKQKISTALYPPVAEWQSPQHLQFSPAARGRGISDFDQGCKAAAELRTLVCISVKDLIEVL
jgi:hypothetical protein